MSDEINTKSVLQIAQFLNLVHQPRTSDEILDDLQRGVVTGLLAPRSRLTQFPGSFGADINHVTHRYTLLIHMLVNKFGRQRKHRLGCYGAELFNPGETLPEI
jgi:hypothetical protein